MFPLGGRFILDCMTRIHLLPKAAGIAVLAGLTALLPGSPAQAAELETEEVVGGWVGELPCAFTSATPSASQPSLVRFECVSGTTWDGAWVGHTVYRVTGTLDGATGDVHGTVDETFVGLVGVTHRPGTLHLLGRVDVDGADNTIVVRERVVGGSGAFKGSSGTVTFEGLQAGAVLGLGRYHGTWIHP